MSTTAVATSKPKATKPPAPPPPPTGQVDPARLRQNRPRLRPAFAANPAPAPAAEATPIAASFSGVPEATIEMVALGELVRAPENVRHIRPDEDVTSLADNIAANGLLQSLIAYRADHELKQREMVWVVGGGRRLAALQALWDRGDVESHYRIPVLVRPREQAIELSLSENIEKRDMSPVDEFLAFQQLIALGTYDEETLAKRFGYPIRYIRQRLRLAQAAPQVLDALAERRITLDSALAYAASQDVKLQAAVFAAQERSTWDQHKPHKIQAAYLEQQSTTASPLYQFVGAEIYEAAGGDYEDDLFSKDTTASGARKLRDGHLLLDLVQQLVHEKATPQEERLRQQNPAYAGFVMAPNARTGGFPWKAPAAPKGNVMVSAGDGVSAEQLWDNAAKAGAPITAIVGVDDGGRLAVRQTSLFVPKEFAAKLKPAKPAAAHAATRMSPEELAARQRELAIEDEAWRVGVGPFVGTPLAGRARFPQHYCAPVQHTPGGRLVAVQIFVSDAEFEASRVEAGRRYDARLAEKQAGAANREARIADHADRVADILAMAPAPTVVVIDGDAFFRVDDTGGWYDDLDLARIGDIEDETDPTLCDLLDNRATPGDLIETFASIEAYDGARG